MMLTILRPLSTSELLDRTFHLYKNAFLIFFTIVAIPQLALLGVKLLYVESVHGMARGMIGLLAIPVSLLTVVCLGISQAATVHAVSNLQLGRAARIGAAFAAIRHSFFRYLWIAFALTYIIAFGFLLLVIPGVYWTLKYAAAMPSAVVEGTGLSESMSRSSELTQHDLQRVLALYALFTLLTWTAGSLVQLGLGLGFPFLRVHGPVVFHATQYVLLTVAAFVTQSLVGPLLTIALTLLYYDERVRKEGFDLQWMMSNLEGAAPAAAGVAAP
jgi:hypothetical protein